MKKYLYLTLINILVLASLFIAIEIVWRTALSIKHLNNPNVSYWGKTWYRIWENLPGITEFDTKLLNVPKKNLNIEKVDFPRWEKNSSVSINELGFRDNSNELIFLSKKRILATGDSFTFGDQVSNKHTWPSCLERKTKIKVDNAGVGGYSAGQALRRAIVESENREYSILIWSIFFEDFVRDFDNNFLIKDDSKKIRFNNFQKTHSSEKKSINIYNYLKEYFFTIYHLERIVKKIKYKKTNSTEEILQNKEKFYEKDLSLIYENIDFLLSKFSKIDIDIKIILYQYAANHENDHISQVNKIKKYIKSKNLDNKFLIVDTLEIFKNLDEKTKHDIWFDHHTKYGNTKVCNYLVNQLDLL